MQIVIVDGKTFIRSIRSLDNLRLYLLAAAETRVSRFDRP